MNAIQLGALLIILGLLGIPTDSLAQATDPVATGMWAGVERVPPGEKLIVKLKDGKKVKGTLSSVSDTGLTLARGKRTTDLEREKVFQVYRLVRKSARTPALWGAISGLAGGGVLGLILYGADAGPFYDPENESVGAVFGSVAGIGAMGAGVGGVAGYALAKRKRRVLIYDEGILNPPAIRRFTGPGVPSPARRGWGI